ncbi:LOW QUALITY PROTEIN: interferon alpha-inducible protein 27-like protein 2A [Monodon monoceros]|uniref:LOW QUALITY PROTEIN: interferon alpha-inducible protein 27-like protein 2A n=1 Tax=Monodon monoceros TaxID=40151 RepID=UPI0010F7C7A3|nr:LOW QUALITY PROTEIN: interferon alpha-inducible protein 27-like protein 2A [Monodon monoceros]
MIKRAAAAAIGGALAVGAVPVVLGAVGFTGAGITASSLAAKMMSAAAMANGGGVAAGSLVATLQSVGAAGLSTSSNILLGSVGSAFGALLGGAKKAPSSSLQVDPELKGTSQEKTYPKSNLQNSHSVQRSMRNKDHLQIVSRRRPACRRCILWATRRPIKKEELLRVQEAGESVTPTRQ